MSNKTWHLWLLMIIVTVILFSLIAHTVHISGDTLTINPLTVAMTAGFLLLMAGTSSPRTRTASLIAIAIFAVVLSFKLGQYDGYELAARECLELIR